jgi:hypothetical protein
MLSEAPIITYEDIYISSVDVTWLKKSSSIIALDGIVAGNSEDIQIKVTTKELDESMLPEKTLSISITLEMNWVEADGTEKIVDQETLELVSGDGTHVGDELKIGNEHFYVVSNDGVDVVLLAKYNLEVGNKFIDEFGMWMEAEIENPSGLQNENMLGYVSGLTEYYGVVPFSSTNYWYGNGLKSEYGQSYPAYVYDDNASIKVYVDDYAEYLGGLGLTIKEARLIKQEELIELGCSVENHKCNEAPSWIYNISYWSGTASDEDTVFVVDYYGYIAGKFYGDYNEAGVRPVIVILSSEI